MTHNFPHGHGRPKERPSSGFSSPYLKNAGKAGNAGNPCIHAGFGNPGKLSVIRETGKANAPTTINSVIEREADGVGMADIEGDLLAGVQIISNEMSGQRKQGVDFFSAENFHGNIN